MQPIFDLSYVVSCAFGGEANTTKEENEEKAENSWKTFCRTTTTRRITKSQNSQLNSQFPN